MVCGNNGIAAIVTVFATSAAGAKLALPACAALTVQVPAASKVSVLPVTVHTPDVLDEKVTGRPELAVAIKAAGAVPRVWLPGETNETVCVPATTVKVFETAVAGKNALLPLCVAVTVQAPAPTSVSRAPLTPHTLGVDDAKATVKREVDVAIKSEVATPKVWLPGDAKLIV